MAASADLTKVYRAEVETADEETDTLSLPADNRLLEEAILRYGVALVAVDPLMSAISDTLDTDVNRQVRRALDPLAGIADRTGAVIAGIAYFNKSASTDASSLITASGAFKDVARFIFALATDGTDGMQVITQTKNSLGRSDLPSLAYGITEAIVPTAKGDAKLGRFVLDGETDRNVRDILADQASGEHGAKARAEECLKILLKNAPRRTATSRKRPRSVTASASARLSAPGTPCVSAPRRVGTEWWVSLPEHEGDLIAQGQDRQLRQTAKGERSWRSWRS